MRSLARSSTLALFSSLAACSHGGGAAASDAGAGNARAASDTGPTEDPEAIEAAHRRALVEKAHEVFDAGPWEGAMLGATGFVTSVVSAPIWPEDVDGGPPSVRLGYLRHGARLAAIPEPIVNDSCPDGWFELVQGGFVCGKNATLDPKSPAVRRAPHRPDMSKALPYDYGVNIRNGTPVYRRVLSLKDREKYEPWLAPPVAAPAQDGGALAPADDEDALDAGSSVSSAPLPVASADPPDAAAIPWFLRDGGAHEIGLEDLRGRGVLVRRMVRGFVLALDRDFKAAHAHWWRTTAGFAVPYERVVQHHPPPEFHGAWFVASKDADASASAVPVAIAVVRSSAAHLVTIDVEKKKVAWGPAVAKRAVLGLTGDEYVANGTTYRGVTGGSGAWVSMNDVTLATPGAPPADLAPDEKWIDVDLTKQILVAFEGARPVFATLTSSGKRDLTDKTKDHPTPTGSFRLQAKHVTATMDGNVAADAPYSIEDVPWIMYFDGSYALHGAFWHANFGHTMSHGCVNLSPADARELFGWTEPRLPDGWHGVFATEGVMGTRVVLHE